MATFTLVDASTDPDTLLETLEDGGTLTLADPDNVSYGIRVDTESNDDIQKVELALSGAKTEGKTEWEPPYSLYGDDGEDNLTGEALPVGSYTLTATAYDANGDVSGTLKVSFTVAAQEQTAVPNTEATGAPAIDGAARVGETLTADTSGIDDDDGLTNVVFAYQWVRSDGSGDSNIQDATGSSYTLISDDEGRTIKVTVSFTDGEGNPESLTSDPTGEVAPASGPLTAFTLVDTSTDPDKMLGTLEDGMALTLAAPPGDSYGIRVDTDSNDDVQKVELALSGAKTEGKTEWEPPYSLYGDSGEENLTGEDLPAGSYDLTATAYENNGDVMGTLKVSFSVAYADPAEEQPPAQNTLATGAPAIDGIARVGETLTADTSGIHDDDGLNNATFSYQWTRSDGGSDTNIIGATGSTYTLVSADEGRTVKVTVSFTDAEGNPETLASAPTGEVDSEAGPLTGFTLVDAADPDQAVLWKHQTDGGTPEGDDTWKEWTDGGTVALGDPDNGSYGIGVDTESGEQIASVRLELTGEENSVDRTDDAAPYSLFGDEGEDALHGEGLPAGSYTLKATAYTEDDEILGTLEISFSVVAVTKPGRPQDLEGEATAQGIELTWEAPPGSAVTHYVVYRGELADGSMNGRPMTRHATVDATGADMQYTDANVEAGKQYRYRVAAVNSAGEGKKSTWLDEEAGDSQS